MQFLLYGANGYTAGLIISLSEQYGITPVLAGRSAEKVKALAEKYGLTYKVFGLDNHDNTVAQLKGCSVVLNCAGPFSRTAIPMVKACLEAKVHYLDITGEIEVFEGVYRFDGKAKEAGILLMPGVGFDVVPSDSLASYLHGKLPDATHLKMAFTSLGGSISHGTASTMIQSLGGPGAVRENGKIVTKPLGHKGMEVDFGKVKHFTICIPWGDVSTAYRTTGIPNIEIYTGAPRKAYNILKLQGAFNWLLKTSLVRNLLQQQIDKKITGPTGKQNEKGLSLIWGEVQNDKGEIRRARYTGAEGYLLTAQTALLITKKVLSGEAKPGYYTPAGLFGHSMILEVDKSVIEDL